MAAAAPVAPAAPAGSTFRFTHTGSPDYTNAAVLRALGDNPLVHLEGNDHPLLQATSFAQWDDSPAVAPATTSPGKCIKQSVLDSWFPIGGVVTDAFRAHPNFLLRSVRADKAGVFFAAHVVVGDLDLSIKYTERTWQKALAASARACAARASRAA